MSYATKKSRKQTKLFPPLKSLPATAPQCGDNKPPLDCLIERLRPCAAAAPPPSNAVTSSTSASEEDSVSA